MNIQQIVDAVSDTCAYQVIRALLDSDDHYGQRELNESNKDTIRREMSRFAIVNRGDRGMHILDSDLKDSMNREGVRPDTYVFPARMSSYIRMRDPYMSEHARGGLGVVSQDEDPAVLTFRGTRVYECRYFETDYIEAPFDPLEQVITYNEYYVQPTGQTLHLYDMDSDNWFPVGTTTNVTLGDGAVSTATGLGGTGGGSPTSLTTGDTYGNVMTPELFDQLNFSRFKQKDAASFNSEYFTNAHSDATRRNVIRELSLMAGTDAVIRPKFLTELFKTHSA